MTSATYDFNNENVPVQSPHDEGKFLGDEFCFSLRFNSALRRLSGDAPLFSLRHPLTAGADRELLSEIPDVYDGIQYRLLVCVANDLSCRDLQFKTSQWLIGKTPDKFLPLGQYLVTADEVSDPQDLELKCFRNGIIRQHSNTSDMIFPVAAIIEELSRYMTLCPGDLILTGTPEGVIMGMPEKKWLALGISCGRRSPHSALRKISWLNSNSQYNEHRKSSL